VRIAPTSELAHARLAAALTDEGKLDQAIATWRETGRLFPTSSMARIGLARALLAHGDAGEAAAECREVLKQEPNTTEVIVMLGTALTDMGQFEEAIPFLERALEMAPQNARTHFSLGLALHDCGTSHSAVRHLNEALHLQPENVTMLWQTAWILATSPDPAVRNGSRGVELASRAIEFSGGKELRAFDALAAALAETGKFAAAVEVAERASAMALSQNDDALADAIEQRARQYRQGLPYRQPASPRRAESAPPEAGK
jgi:tetratricopeptide (TPR) repeat protein